MKIPSTIQYEVTNLISTDINEVHQVTAERTSISRAGHAITSSRIQRRIIEYSDIWQPHMAADLDLNSPRYTQVYTAR
jgi:hypothetical protein